jgi:tetratricopeptide (TPR) repeat protein
MTMSPETGDAIYEDIVAAVGCGDRSLALRLAAEALDHGVHEPLVLLLAAEDLEGHGRAFDALLLLEQAVDIAPEETEVWRRFGGLLIRQGRVADGLAALKTALKLDPDIVATLIDAGAASFRLAELTAAEGYFRRAAELAPEEAEPLAALAAIAARRQKPGEARVLAERALAMRPGILTAEMAIGRADLADNLAESTCVRMTLLLGRVDVTDDNRVGVLDLRAEALDAMGRPADAFADYEARNAILRRINEPRIKRDIGERRRDQAQRLTGYFSAAPAALWHAGAGEDKIGERIAIGHVFLVGFPRSGTTLLEKSLAGHANVVTLAEVDHLARVGQRWLADRLALDTLARLTPKLADPAREVYWRSVHETVGEDLVGKVLVDKLPLHTVALPVISKLFPRAKILFALRDPRDVVFSCFRRRFQINSAMFEFLNLEDAARYYDRVMTLARIYRSLLPLSVREVRHEAMVANFEAEVRDVLDFIGLEWDPAITRFAESTPTDPRTPSDIQLTRGLNSGGVGQWRRYETQLVPILGILESWVKQFGYPASLLSRQATVAKPSGFRVRQTFGGGSNSV